MRIFRQAEGQWIAPQLSDEARHTRSHSSQAFNEDRGAFLTLEIVVTRETCGLVWNQSIC